MHLTTIEPARITGTPMVCLVDIHGEPVPDAERHVPTCPPDPDDPAEWPESNDVDGWYWELGPDPSDAEAAAATLEDLPFPDAPDADPAIRFPGVASLAERLGIAPIAGGSPEAEPFEPTAEDLADYSRWSAELDARRDSIDFYARHPLGEFNALRTD